MEERFETFTVLLAKISRNIKRLKSEEMAELQLKGPHVSCLYYLRLSDGLTASQLCDRCEEDKGAISRSLDYLEKTGYLTCCTSGIKRYKSPIRLTPKGRQAGDIIVQKIEDLAEEASLGLTQPQREAMYQALACISGNLDRLWAKRKEQARAESDGPQENDFE